MYAAIIGTKHYSNTAHRASNPRQFGYKSYHSLQNEIEKYKVYVFNMLILDTFMVAGVLQPTQNQLESHMRAPH